METKPEPEDANKARPVSRVLSPEVKKWVEDLIELREVPGDTWVYIQGYSSEGLHLIKCGSKDAKEFKKILVKILLANLEDPERPEL